MQVVSENEGADREIGLRRELDAAVLGRALGRRRRWIIAPALLCLLASTVGVNWVKPRYTAEAKILVENQESFFTRPDRSEAVSQVPLPDDEAMQSQVQLVSSRDIARGVLKELDLAGSAEFDPAASGLGTVHRLLVLIGLERDPLRATAEDRLLTAYYDRLNVYPIARSRVLSIQFTSTDADLAANAANAVADRYIGLQSDAKRDNARIAATSLASLIADLKVKVALADTQAQAFRASNGLLVGTNNTTITSQQLSDLTGQLAQARNAEAEAKSRAKLLGDMIGQNRIGDVPDVANSDLVRRISEQRVALKAQIAQQAMTLLPGHPHMRELNAELGALEGQMRVAGEKIVKSLENDSRIAAGRVENLQAVIDTQKQTATAAGTDQVRLNELEQQARLLRDQLEFSTQKYQEALARENAISTPADARVISRAIAPELPSFPKKLPTIAILTLAGLVVSAGTVIARELMSGRAFLDDMPVRQPAPLGPTTVPMSTAAGHVPTGRRPRVPHEPQPDEEHGSPDADLVTMLDMVADHHKGGGGVRLLVMASADAATIAPDGALRLGRALARRSRAILVDCGVDEGLALLLAAPRAPEAPPVRGLMNLLAGDTSFAEVIHRDPQSRLHIVPYGTGTADGYEEGYGVLVDALAETYDHVVLAVPQPDGSGTVWGASQADLAILLVTASTDQTQIEVDRVMLHTAGVPSVYVLDVADLGTRPGRQHAAA